MFSKNKVFLSVLIVVLAIAGGWYLAKNQRRQSGEIKIGAMLALSGDGAAWGENAKRGVEIAVEKINEEGGINGRKVNLIIEDTATDAKKAVAAYQKFISIDKVEAIIGPLMQTEVGAVAPLIAQNNIPVVAPSYANINNRPNPNNPLTIWMDPRIQAGRMAEYVFGKGTKRVAVLGTLDSWEDEVSSTFAEKFISLGGEISSKEIVQPEAAEIRVNVAKIIQSKPEAIFLGTYYQFIQGIQDIKKLGYKGNIYSIEVDSYLAGETKPYSDNLEFISPDFYSEQFLKEFEKKFGQKPGIPAGQAYDAAFILADALKSKNPLKEMEQFESFEGVSGKIEKTGDNKIIFPTAIFKINNGEITKIK